MTIRASVVHPTCGRGVVLEYDPSAPGYWFVPSGAPVCCEALADAVDTGYIVTDEDRAWAAMAAEARRSHERSN